MTERERNIRNLKAIGSGVTTALVSLSCVAGALAPIQAETPTGNTDNSSQSLTETPDAETDEAYVNNEFDWTANPAAVEKTVEETGLSPDQVYGYSVVIGRDSIQVVGSDGQLTSPPPVTVDFVTTSGLGFDSNGDPVVQDHLITVDPETGESIRIPLYRGIETDDNGRQWVVQGYFNDTEDIDGTTLTKYPQSASKDIEDGKPTYMLLFPTPYINALLYRDPEDITPIRVDIKPNSSQNVVSVATPFSDQVIDISYSPKTPEPPPMSPTVAPATVVAPTTTAENTPTQEVPILNPGYTLNIDPTNIIGPVLTSNDINGPHATWINKKCKIPSAVNTTIKAEVYDKEKEQIVLFAMREGLPVQARNVQICSIDKVDASAFGMIGKDALYLVSQNFADRNGNQLTFQVLLGQSGIDNMVNNKILPTQTDKYGPRMSILSKLSRDQQTKFLLNGATGGSGDPRLFTDEDLENFYSTQGTSLEEVNRMLRHISENGGNIDDESIKFFSRVVVFGFPSNPPTAD